MAAISGGDKLKAKLREISERLGNDATLRVGFLEGATYPDGTSVPMVAAIQNYGAPKAGIPPRPFFTKMVVAGRAKWGDELSKILGDVNYDVTAAFKLMGENMRDQLQESIRSTNAPPLKAETIERKGFAKPLIDTAHMLDSVDYEVTE